MKKSIGIALLVFLGLQACAQKVQPKDVPDAVKASMEKAFPGITAKWEKEEANFEANFSQIGHEMSAVFDPNGTMLETEIEIPVGEFPAKASAYLNEKYKGQKVKEASKITDKDGKVFFEAAFKGKDVLFDADGNFVKEITT